jgi:hypothetical protein
MHEFLRAAAEKLSLDEATASEAASEILLVLRGRLEPVEFGRLLTAVPGSAELLAAKWKPSTTKGVAGQLHKAASILGNRSGATLDATAFARRCGLASESVGPLVGLFLEFLGQKAGDELVARIRHVAPELDALARLR